MKQSYLIASCLFILVNALAVNCTIKSRGNLQYPDNLDEETSGSSFSFNGQPIFQNRNPNFNNNVELAVNRYERLQQQQQQQQQRQRQQQQEEEPSQPVLSRNRNKLMKWDDELNELKSALEEASSQVSTEQDSLVMTRDKKSRPIVMADVAKAKTGDNENAPILNHGRKTYVAANTDNESPKTCASLLHPRQNTIIDSETSIKGGAKFLGVEYITNQAAMITISGMHDACKQKCCDNDKCDTSLLQMKMGENGYRCYLYKCSDMCNFVQHKDYVVFKARDEEQSQILKPEQQNQPSPTDDITTGHEHHDSHSFDMDAISVKPTTVANSFLARLDPEDRDYFSSIENTSKSSTALAVILLVLGIMLVISFFGYLVLSTKFVSKRLSCLKKKKGKNVDVDEDYLINGMYL